MKIEVTYKWASTGKGPDEVISVTLRQAFVPRIGDKVWVNVTLESGEAVTKFGKVESVLWTVTNSAQSVEMFLHVM